MATFIKPNYEILSYPHNAAELVERAGRTCYKSEDKIGCRSTVPCAVDSCTNCANHSSYEFVRRLIKRQHHAMLEHGGVITVRFICDRGVSHELVRHRIASFSQESTRYVKYKEDDDFTFIMPSFFKPGSDEFVLWENACQNSQDYYTMLSALGCSPQQARSVLVHSIKTEIVVSANIREWRHILSLRALDSTGPAHPQMKELMVPLLVELNEKVPVVFEDLYEQLSQEDKNKYGALH